MEKVIDSLLLTHMALEELWSIMRCRSGQGPAVNVPGTSNPWLCSYLKNRSTRWILRTAISYYGKPIPNEAISPCSRGYQDLNLMQGAPRPAVEEVYMNPTRRSGISNVNLFQSLSSPEVPWVPSTLHAFIQHGRNGAARASKRMGIIPGI